MHTRLLYLLLALLAGTCVRAQNTVTGTIIDTDGNPMIGATVLIVGSGGGAATDLDGRYQLQAQPTDSLRVSYTGYANQTQPVGTRTQIDFNLQSDVELLEDVVVIGYGTVKKSDVTGSVGSYDPTLEEASQFTDAQSLLQGRVAGVQVVGSGGEPGAPLSIRIRGANSLRGDNEPLYVIDGIIVKLQYRGRRRPAPGGQLLSLRPERLDGPQPPGHRKHRNPQGRFGDGHLRLPRRERRGADHH